LVIYTAFYNLQLGVLQFTVGRFTVGLVTVYSWAFCNLHCILQFTIYHLLLGVLPSTVGRFFLLIWKGVKHFSVRLRGIISLEFLECVGVFKFCVFLGVLPARVSALLNVGIPGSSVYFTAFKVGTAIDFILDLSVDVV